jgi:hypothetical protein
MPASKLPDGTALAWEFATAARPQLSNVEADRNARRRARAAKQGLGRQQSGGCDVVEGGLEVLVRDRRVGVESNGPHGFLADSGGQGVGVAGVRRAVGPVAAGHGVEGEIAGCACAARC